MDRQLGKLFDHIRNDPALRRNTLILVCSDNGPERGAGSAGPFRGYKTQLYNLKTNPTETKNLSAQHPELISKFKKSCITWHKSLPPDNGPRLTGPFRRKPTKTPKKI